MLLRSFLAMGCVLGCFAAAPASAHFKLQKPTSWLKEDATGGPQKGSPCGPGNSGFLGDDVQPVPTSGMVSEFHAGDMVEVELDETIPHPGYFRIALAKDRSELTIPPVDDPSSCALDLSKVPTGAHDNILADGLWKEANQPSARHLTTMVKLPDQPCDKCTIQVVQVMKDHGLNSCYYYHCADIKILPASGSTGSAGSSAAGSGGSAGSAGASAGAAAGGAGGRAAAGAGGAGASAAGSPAMATAGTTGGAGTGAAGRATAVAGSLAAASGGAGSPAGAAGTAGIGMTTSPTTAAGAAGTAPTTPPAESSSGCALTGTPASRAPLAVCGAFAALAFAYSYRARRRRGSARAGRGHE